MIANTAGIYRLAALEDDFGIVAKYTTVCSSVYQCTSLASLNRMLGCMNFVRSSLGFPILLGLTWGNSASVAFQLIIGTPIRFIQRYHRLIYFGRI